MIKYLENKILIQQLSNGDRKMASKLLKSLKKAVKE